MNTQPRITSHEIDRKARLACTLLLAAGLLLACGPAPTGLDGNATQVAVENESTPTQATPTVSPPATSLPTHTSIPPPTVTSTPAPSPTSTRTARPSPTPVILPSGTDLHLESLLITSALLPEGVAAGPIRNDLYHDSLIRWALPHTEYFIAQELKIEGRPDTLLAGLISVYVFDTPATAHEAFVRVHRGFFGLPHDNVEPGIDHARGIEWARSTMRASELVVARCRMVATISLDTADWSLLLLMMYSLLDRVGDVVSCLPGTDVPVASPTTAPGPAAGPAAQARWLVPFGSASALSYACLAADQLAWKYNAGMITDADLLEEVSKATLAAAQSGRALATWDPGQEQAELRDMLLSQVNDLNSTNEQFLRQKLVANYIFFLEHDCPSVWEIFSTVWDTARAEGLTIEDFRAILDAYPKVLQSAADSP